MKKLLLLLAALLISAPVFATTSTIDPTVPATNSVRTSAQIRDQFLAAYNDVNNIYDTSLFVGLRITGDCSLTFSSQTSDAITCTKSNGSAFGALAFLNSVPPADLPTPTPSTLGGVFSGTAPSNQFMTGINTSGAPIYAQPSASNLSNGTSGSGAVVLATGNAATATALASLPTQCTSGQFSTGIAASGNANCSVPVGNVSSVFGRTGAVVATNGDYAVSQVTGAAPLASPTFTGTVNGAAAIWSGQNTASFFTATGTGADQLPSGTTGQRPSATAGMIRYNTTFGAVETYVNSAWQQITGPPGVFFAGWYGALGIASNDCPSLQNAVNAAAAYGIGGKVEMDAIAYKATGSTGACITYDPTVTQLDWNGGGIVSSQTGGNLFTITQSSSAPTYQAYKGVFQGGYFVGPGAGTTVDFKVYNTNGGTKSSREESGFYSATGFRYGEDYQNGSYLIHSYGVSYSGLNTCYHMGSTFSNAGENITHYGGLCAQSALGAYINESQQSNTFNFDHKSFDFDTMFFDDEAGEINCDTCHFEMDGGALVGPLFKVANTNAATIRMRGGDWFLDPATASEPYSGASALIEADGLGRFYADGMLLQGLGLTSGTLGTGTGFIDIRNTVGYSNSLGNYQIEDITGINENYMSDGGFEQSTILDLVWISSDTNAITNRFTARDTVLTNDSATCGGHSGSQSLKLAKAFGSGSASASYIAAPIPSHQMAIGSFWYSKPGTQTGTVFLTYFAVQILGYDANGLPVLGKSSSSLGQTTVTLTSSALAWTQMKLLQAPANIMPPWATHIAIQVNAVNMNAGAFCIDDVVFNSM